MIKLGHLSSIDVNLLTLDKWTQLFAKVEYDEKERCVFCSERLKGLSFRIGQKNGRVCSYCCKNLANSSPIYIDDDFCAYCHRLVEDYFVCNSCKYQNEFDFKLCPKCCLSGLEKDEHKLDHSLLFVKKELKSNQNLINF